MSTVYSLGLGHSLHPPAVEAEGLGGAGESCRGAATLGLASQGGPQTAPSPWGGGPWGTPPGSGVSGMGRGEKQGGPIWLWGYWGGTDPPESPAPPMTSRYLHLLREPQRHPGAPSVHRGDVPKLQGTGQRGSPRPKAPCPRSPPVAQHRAWGGHTTLTPSLPPELLLGVRVPVRRRRLPVLLHHLLRWPRGAHVRQQQLLQVGAAGGWGPVGLGSAAGPGGGPGVPCCPPESKGRGLPLVPWGAGPCRGDCHRYGTPTCAHAPGTPWLPAVSLSPPASCWGWCRGSRGPVPLPPARG